ncbi:MAG: NADP-dependent oxidoreductase, partial [Nocardioidaceae bacterium]
MTSPSTDQSMTAYGFGSYGDASVQEFLTLPVPVPGPGEVLVRVRASGVNPADHKVRSGARAATVPVEFPAVMGREASGTVVSLGPDVVGLSPGDEVFGSTAPGFGSYAEYTVLGAGATAPKPAGLGFADAAAIPVAVATAYDAVHQLDLEPGSKLLVIGAGGGVGGPAVQIARHRGLTVVGTASAAKRAYVETLGARWVDYAGDAAAEVGEVDAIVDTVGGVALRELAGLLSRPGAVVSAGGPDVATELGGGPIARRRTTGVYAEVAQLVV